MFILSGLEMSIWGVTLLFLPLLLVWAGNSFLFSFPSPGLSDSFDMPLIGGIFSAWFFMNLGGLSGGWPPLASWPVLALSISLGAWLGVMFRWFTMGFVSVFAHYTPFGLPVLGALPMTAIEVASTVVRPLTLGMRLCANISGGHLITELVEEMGGKVLSLSMVAIYETFVSAMQALIFSLLLMNYHAEASDST